MDESLRNESGLITEDTVIAWSLNLEKMREDYPYLFSLLSPEESEKCERFFFEKDKKRYVTSHGILRLILGHYLNIEPRKIEYVTNQYGKPELPREINKINIRFNISHSHNRVILGFCTGREVGVDVEYINRRFPTIEIARRFFSPNEVDALSYLPEELQVEAFYKCWTQKEAYIKAQGKGLTIPLDSFDVSVSPSEPAGILSSRSPYKIVTEWQIKEIDSGVEYKSAVCAQGSDWILIFREWLW